MPAKIQILSNTNFPLVNVLKSELMDSACVRIAVAFLKKSGIGQISDPLNYALQEKGATVEIIVGLDFRTTDANALSTLKEIESSNQNFNFYCFGDRYGNFNDLVFHPKIYLFSNETARKASYTSIVGSSNLTGGGLTTNFEVNSVIREDTPVEIDELRQTEQSLPETIPSLKRVIIEYILEQEAQGINEVPLRDLYAVIPQLTIERHMNMKMNTLDNTIRGELNKHEEDSHHPDGTKLFKRAGHGLYTLTDRGRAYSGR